jgi:hypothetical protein
MARNKSVLAAVVLLALVSWGASSSRLESPARGLLLTYSALSSLQLAGTSYARQVELSQEAQPR